MLNTSIIEDNKYMLVLRLHLPLLKAQGAPWFKGNNISTFLEQYTDMYKDYQVSTTTKREHIIKYILLLYKD
jgi:hypothetical protein